jgi:hypothetical protein
MGGGSRFKASLGKKLEKPHLLNNQSKMDWRWGSRVECLLCKCEALSSNSNTTKEKELGAREAQACNPRYSGGRDQEDRGLKAAWANSSRDPISKNPSQKKKG